VCERIAHPFSGCRSPTAAETEDIVEQILFLPKPAYTHRQACGGQLEACLTTRTGAKVSISRAIDLQLDGPERMAAGPVGRPLLHDIGLSCNNRGS
jgi:hypothetical protein